MLSYRRTCCRATPKMGGGGNLAPKGRGVFGEERNLSAPSGHLPLQGRLLALVWLHCVHAAQQCFQCEWLLLLTPNPSDKAFRRLYTVSRRNAMERNRRRPRLCPPGKAPIQAMAGSAYGVRGPALAAWKIWLAPRAALPTLPACKVGRPSADGRNTL